MKKALLLFASAALLFAGCQKEQIASGETDGDPVTVTFTTSLESGVATKATIDNDGHAAKVNHWVLEVRDAQNDLFYEEERDVTAGTLQQTYELKLFKNQSYTLQFWADTKGAYNTDDLTAVSAKDAVANKDSRDAFSANVDYTSLVSESKDVTLTRPFAQLNIITCDLQDLETSVVGTTYAKYAPAELQVVASVPTTFNVQDQTAGTAASQTLTAAASYADFSAGMPETTLFMDYIFASKDAADVLPIDFSFKSNEQLVEYNFTNIPLQRNYRTNIKGQLMSNDSEWKVVIDPIWNTPEYVEEQWSAGMVTPVTPDEEGVYNINLPSELAWIAQEVNNGNTFTGKTVKLAKDINLNNGAWTPIGKSDALSFQGTFDGNDKTIKNLNVNLGESSVNAGLFSFVKSGTVKNFTIDGAKVSVVGGAAGAVAGKMFPGGLIEGVTIKNAELTGCRQMGGIVGSIYGKVKNCTAENVKITATPNLVGGSYDNGDKCGAIVGFSTFDNDGGEVSGNIAKNVIIKGYRDIGGIVGAADCSKTTITGNEVHGAELTADQTVNFYGKKDYNVGAIVGRVNAGTVDASNTSENVITKTIGNAAEKALDEATEGSTVTLKDVDSGNTVNIPAGLAKNVTIASDAVDKSEVSRFEIPAGAKIENLTIKDFEPTLQAGSDKPFVHVPADASFTMTIKDVIATGDGVKNNWNTLVRVEPCDNADLASEIVIDGVEIDGAKYLVYSSGGSRAISLTIKNCTIKNLTSWMAMANGSQFKNVTIDNCTIENCSGIVKFAMDSFTFTNNVLIGNNKEDHTDSKKCIVYRDHVPSTVTVFNNFSNGVSCDDAIIAQTF